MDYIKGLNQFIASKRPLKGDKRWKDEIRMSKEQRKRSRKEGNQTGRKKNKMESGYSADTTHATTSLHLSPTIF